MAGAVTDLGDLAAEYLAAVVEAVALAPGGPIARTHTSPGPPSWDCCLVGESMVSTERGPIPIAEVVPGDRVWAFEEGHLALHRVVRSFSRGVQPVLRARGGRRQIVGTADHPMLRLRPTRARTSGGRPQEWRSEWIGIGELRQGDVLVSLDHLAEDGTPADLPDGTPLSPDLAWLLGLWVGDGCFNLEDGICLFIHNGVRERATEVLRQTWNVNPRGNSERLDVKSRELYAVFSQVFERTLAPEKRVPEIIWGREPKTIRSFLDGYAAADGHVNRSGYREYATASRRLASEVRMLHMGLGDAVSNLAVKERTAPIVIRGRTVARALPLHRFNFSPGSSRRDSIILDYRGARRALPDERLGISTVSAVEEWGEAETFDLEVEGAHNFIADGLVVHNCPMACVHVGGTAEGMTAPLMPPLMPGERARVQGAVHLVALTATVLRCSPVIGGDGQIPVLPSTAELTASARETMGDVWAVWNHVRTRVKAGTLFASPSGRREVFFDPAVALSTAGGCSGWQIPLRVQLSGFEL